MAGTARTNRWRSARERRADARGRRTDAVALLARHFGVAGGSGVRLGHRVVAAAGDVGRGQGGLAAADSVTMTSFEATYTARVTQY